MGSLSLRGEPPHTAIKADMGDLELKLLYVVEDRGRWLPQQQEGFIISRIFPRTSKIPVA
jgi:hypothetical protein